MNDSDRPTREDALHLLGLGPGADPTEVKRAYRRLAQHHHPDRGGSSETFHAIRQAYERLRDDGDRARPPAVARGRPSRPFVVPDTPAHADLSTVSWDAEVTCRPFTLDRDRLAVWLAEAPEGSLVRPLSATSRGPGSRLNRVAAHLAGEFTARLAVTEAADDRGSRVVALEVGAATRRARRALDAVALDGWVRRRGSSSTQLRTTLVPSVDRRETAVRATDRLERMLEALEWPFGSWTVTTSTTPAATAS